MSPRERLNDVSLKLGIQGILALVLVGASFILAATSNPDLNGFLGLTGFAVAWAYKNGDSSAAAAK